MEANRAAELLLRIQAESRDRAGRWLLLPLLVQVLLSVALIIIMGTSYAGLILAGSLVFGLATMLAVARIEREVSRAVGRAAAVYALQVRIVEFRVPEWHIVGAE